MSVIAIDSEKKLLQLINYQELFWNKVDKTSDCWIWTAGCDKEGRARVTIGYGKNKITISAARYIYIVEHKKWLSPFECVLHSCDNIKCVNPNHLWLGSKDDNNKDRARKNRSAIFRGSSNHNSKLKEDQVREIKFSNLPSSILAKKFSIHASTVWLIRTNKLWSHINE